MGARKSSLINSTIRIRSCKGEVVAEGLSTTVGIAEQAQVRRLAAPYPQPDHYGPEPDPAGAGYDHALCESERVVLCLLYTGKFCVHCSVCAHNRALCHERCGTCQNRPADPPDVESFNRNQYSGKLPVVFWRQADPEPVWSRLCPAGCVEPAYPGTQCVSGDHQGPLYSYLPYS